MRLHRPAILIAVSLFGIALHAPKAEAQTYGATHRALPNNTTFYPYVGPAPQVYYFPSGSYPATFYVSYGYSYPAWPYYPVAFVPYPLYFGYAYTYPSYTGYPSPVFVPTYYAPLYSNYFYPYGYGYYHYRGW